MKKININIENFPAFINMEDARYAVKCAKRDSEKCRALKEKLIAEIEVTTDAKTKTSLLAQLKKVKAELSMHNLDIKKFKAEQDEWEVEVNKLKAKYGIVD